MSIKYCTSFFIATCLLNFAYAQNINLDLNKNWQFHKQGEARWYKAIVPGTVHTDLLDNHIIPDPFFRENEKTLHWIDKANWEYKMSFNVDAKAFSKQNIELVFDGLDTYADVFLNGALILRADNMFRGWTLNVKPFIKKIKNELLIKFSSAQNKVDSIAKSKLPFILPDNNRVYVRKAAFQFGWDWGPKLVGCGIWKRVKLKAWNGVRIEPSFAIAENNIKLIQKKDSTGTSFYFEKSGKPIYCKGANWIPADIFLPRVKKEDYRRLLQMAKDANMNMLRVWGGGIYEADEFYELCDEMDIMVWQDFMFAGGMYPGDDEFFKNVRAEVKYQVERLRKHPCIVLWCGNNEIDEAWHNWGWQGQFKLHGADSAKVWNDYKRLFKDSLLKWVTEFDGTRQYISTSPMHGWGREESFKEGDSHYWGLWWGLQDWEKFETHTGRFVSEYGMQAMPNYTTIEKFTEPGERNTRSAVIQWHQKANEGFKKLDHYLDRYFIDSSKINTLSLEDYTYLTQCLQHYILKNSIAIHRNKEPINMGTLLWQLNDCWPATSWSIIDYYGKPKAAYYAVKKAYGDDIKQVVDSIYPKHLKLLKPVFSINKTSALEYTIVSNAAAKYIYVDAGSVTENIDDNYFDLEAGEIKTIRFNATALSVDLTKKIKITSLYDVLRK